MTVCQVKDMRSNQFARDCIAYLHIFKKVERQKMVTQAVDLCGEGQMQ